MSAGRGPVQGVQARFAPRALPRARTGIRAGGDGVPNQGPWKHRRGGPTPGVVGYRIIFHDQQITGDNYVHSEEISPSAYALIHSAAAQGQTAFNAAVQATSCPWAAFLAEYPVDLDELRLGVLDLA